MKPFLSEKSCAFSNLFLRFMGRPKVDDDGEQRKKEWSMRIKNLVVLAMCVLVGGEAARAADAVAATGGVTVGRRTLKSTFQCAERGLRGVTDRQAEAVKVAAMRDVVVEAIERSMAGKSGAQLALLEQLQSKFADVNNFTLEALAEALTTCAPIFSVQAREKGGSASRRRSQTPPPARLLTGEVVPGSLLPASAHGADVQQREAAGVRAMIAQLLCHQRQLAEIYTPGAEVPLSPEQAQQILLMGPAVRDLLEQILQTREHGLTERQVQQLNEALQVVNDGLRRQDGAVTRGGASTEGETAQGIVDLCARICEFMGAEGGDLSGSTAETDTSKRDTSGATSRISRWKLLAAICTVVVAIVAGQATGVFDVMACVNLMPNMTWSNMTWLNDLPTWTPP